MIDKQAIIRHFDSNAHQRPAWFRRNYVYHKQIIDACRPFLNPDSRVLELGCSTGDMLNALQPGYGVGVDISPASIAVASSSYPHLHWVCADIEALPDAPPLDAPFDLILLSDVVTYLDDIQQTLHNIRCLTTSHSRILISLWNWMWRPVLRIGEVLGLKSPDLNTRYNWLSPTMIGTLLELAGYETLQVLPGILLPYPIPAVFPLVNSLSHAPLLRRLTLLSMVMARPLESTASRPASVTVVIPTRNEVANVEAAIQRTPAMGAYTELLFVDGNSSDGTVEKIQEQIRLHPERDIKLIPQVPVQTADASTPPNLMLKLGKGDAVRKGFDAAQGNILMILDSDLTVPPEELPKFYHALVDGKAQLVNGTRFVYGQEAGAMRELNRWGNVFFSQLFSWLLGQPITDTLCGTKALFKVDYEGIVRNRSYFGDFDPFGDFDLLFGAARLRYRIIDLPIRYRARTYGDSKVRVSVHGPLLGRMGLIAFWQFKIRPLFGAARPATDLQSTHQDDSGRGWILAGAIGLAGLLLLRAMGRSSHKTTPCGRK
ncbi:MAG TPA: glycosyltransferase [Aggregatilineaceae bacterium]|nr:glycosyltransferase [Aggregatilineaceae bacterium]